VFFLKYGWNAIYFFVVVDILDSVRNLQRENYILEARAL
jgi:hypothetical protein